MKNHLDIQLLPACRMLTSRLTLVLATLAAPAFAQDDLAGAAQPAASSAEVGIEEIIVTAQKRGENIQRVPIAITALSGEALQAKGILNVEDFARSTPTLTAAPYSTGVPTLFFFMRGMGANDPAQVTRDSAVGVYENGIYNPRPQAIIFDLSDPDRIETLRGPQGTLYGRNTTGGAINVISRPPSGEFEFRQVASYASRDQYRSVTNVDLPSFANIKIKGTLALGGDDGYEHNVKDPSVPDANDFGIERHVGGRIAVLWQPSSDITADYSFQVAKITSTPHILDAPAQEGLEIIPGIPYRSRVGQAYRPARLPLSHSSLRDHGLTLEWRLSDALALRSITGVRRLHVDTYQDTLEGYAIPIVSTNDISTHMLSQEFQAVGSAWDDRIKYAAGLYYYRERASHAVAFIVSGLAAEYDINARSISKAAYLQATVTPPVLNGRLDLTAGGRYTEDTRRAVRDFTYAGIPLENDIRNRQQFRRFNPAFTASYRWSQYISSYAKVSTGYRAGGSSETSPDFTDTFGPENLTSYELGLKAELFDRKLRTNFAAFYNRFKDIQLDLTLDPINPTITVTQNAGRATIKGVEADITAAVTRNLLFNLSYAYLDAKITEVRAGPGMPNLADLYAVPYAPKHSVNVSVDYVALPSPDGDLTIHVDYNYKGAVNGTSGAGRAVPGNRFYIAPSRQEVNGRISLERRWFDKPITIALFAKNLFNNRRPVYRSAVGAQALGFFYSNNIYAAPRTVGVELSLAY